MDYHSGCSVTVLELSGTLAVRISAMYIRVLIARPYPLCVIYQFQFPIDVLEGIKSRTDKKN